MKFFLHEGGVVMSSQITHVQSFNIQALAHTLGSCALFHSLSQLLSWNGIPLLSRFINPQSAGGRSERTQEPGKNCRVKLNHLPMHQGSPLIPIFRT